LIDLGLRLSYPWPEDGQLFRRRKAAAKADKGIKEF